MHFRIRSNHPSAVGGRGLASGGRGSCRAAPGLPFILCLTWIPVALAEVNVADPGTFVVDKAGIIDAGVEQQIEGWLRELEQKTTAQVKVLTVPTNEGEDIFTFAQRHAERWKLGRQGKDNGALVVVALKEREFRIQTGYGLEPSLPDSWCGSLHREVIVPNFRAGKYSDGMYKAVTAIANKVADASNVQLTGIPQYRFAPRRTDVRGLWGIPFFVIIIIVLLTRRRRYYRRWGGGLGEAIFWGSVLNNLGRGGRGGWGGGFGGFGGGGGGFGGSFGGGGRFGGGGGGGRW